MVLPLNVCVCARCTCKGYDVVDVGNDINWVLIEIIMMLTQTVWSIFQTMCASMVGVSVCVCVRRKILNMLSKRLNRIIKSETSVLSVILFSTWLSLPPSLSPTFIVCFCFLFCLVQCFCLAQLETVVCRRRRCCCFFIFQFFLFVLSHPPTTLELLFNLQ